MLCLNYFFAFAHVLKRSASSKADHQERVAQTCHTLLYYQVQVFVVQEDCYLLGRSRRGQALKEEDFLGCKESGVLGGGRPFLKLLFCSFSWQVGRRYHESGHTWSRLGIPSPSSRRDGSICSKGHISYPIWSPQMVLQLFFDDFVQDLVFCHILCQSKILCHLNY